MPLERVRAEVGWVEEGRGGEGGGCDEHKQRVAGASYRQCGDGRGCGDGRSGGCGSAVSVA